MRTRFLPHVVRPFKSVRMVCLQDVRTIVVVQAFRPAVAVRPEALHYDRISSWSVCWRHS